MTDNNENLEELVGVLQQTVNFDVSAMADAIENEDYAASSVVFERIKRTFEAAPEAAPLYTSAVLELAGNLLLAYTELEKNNTDTKEDK